MTVTTPSSATTLPMLLADVEVVSVERLSPTFVRVELGSPDLADFKRPRHYFFVDAIPSNPTGKVERGKLKEILLKNLDRELE